MRYYRYLLGFYNAAVALSIVLIDLFRAAFVYGAEHAWHSLHTAGLVAYRKIADLKPVYRDSYDTHGLSLGSGRSIY